MNNLFDKKPLESITKEDIKKIFLYSTVGELRRATSTKPTEMVEATDSVPRLYYREERNPESNKVQYTVHAIDADVIKFLWDKLSSSSDEPSEDPTEEPTNELVNPVYTIDELITAISEGGELTLASPMEVENQLIVDKDTTLHLNGQSISNTKVINHDSIAIEVTSGELTIDGEGEVLSTAEVSEDYSMAVWAHGGKVIINGGTFKNQGDSTDLIYASAGGNVEINGGTFMSSGPSDITDNNGTLNYYNALNCKDADRKNGVSDIAVKGGKFFNFNPINNYSEGNSTSYVPEGYTVMVDGIEDLEAWNPEMGDKWYEVVIKS